MFSVFKSKLHSLAPPIVLAGCLCALTFIGLQWLGESELLRLAFVRQAMSEGQYWRLMTGHFIHFTHYHAVMNGAGLVLVCWALLYRQTRLFFIAINIFLPLWISLGIFLFFPEVEQYRGYSGVIHGLIATGLLLEWSQYKTLYSGAALLLAGKIVYEHLPSYDVNYLIGEIGVPVAIEAHLLGLIGGALFGLGALLIQRQRRVKS